ncbi:MAG: tetratricopeptide repeat protein [Anaerolineales bacterium]
MTTAAEAEHWANEGKRKYQDGDFETAASSFGQAAAAYRQDGQHLLAAEMANNQSVALAQLDRYDQAFRAVDGTASIFEAAGDLQKAAQAHGNLGSALEGLGRLDEAEAAYLRATELFGQIGDTDERAHTYKALARLRVRQGQPLDAVTTMQLGLQDSQSRSLSSRLLSWILQLPSRFMRG